MNPTERFSDRAAYYARCRPGYPAELVGFLRRLLGSQNDHPIADIGSGTGLLTEQLLKVGSPVFAVEPNPPMRAAAEAALSPHPAFRSVAATAESTTLADDSVDLVAAGQAFHWFDHPKTKTEFARILKPGGWVALIWNERKAADDSFNAAYESFLADFRSSDSRQKTSVADLTAFFTPLPIQVVSFHNQQSLDLNGLTGRVISSSDMPLPGHPRFGAMSQSLQRLFDAHQNRGVVRIDYDTRVYYGSLA